MMAVMQSEFKEQRKSMQAEFQFFHEKIAEVMGTSQKLQS